MKKRLYKASSITIIFLLFCCVLPSFLVAEQRVEKIDATGSLELIEAAFNAGSISESDKLILSLQSIFASDKLPKELQGDDSRVVKSASDLMISIKSNWDLLSSDQQAEASAMMARPTMDSLYISPSGYFAIHYELTYPDSVPSEDLDLNEVPDYVERAGLYLDSAYQYYHTHMGYMLPPDDGDGMYDIYMLRLAGLYGITIPEYPGDSSWGDYVSYIQLNSTFQYAADNDDPEGKVIGALKVTLAHEYFHGVQLAYEVVTGEDFWWSEGTAVYYEDVLFDEVNDCYAYLPYFFDYPDTFLIDTSYFATYHDYSCYIYPSFLSEKFGSSIFPEIWNSIRYNSVTASIDLSLSPFMESMSSTFPEFTVWNYFTGERADTLYHDKGADFPDIRIDSFLNCPFIGLTPSFAPDGFASNYIMTYPDSWYNGILGVEFDGENSVEWEFSYVAFVNDQGVPCYDCEVNSIGKTGCGIYNFLKYDSVLFIPSVVSQYREGNDYLFDSQIYPFGDVDGSFFTNILDITYLINYVYLNGIPPKYSVYNGDVNCDGLVNINDISYLISYVYFSGPAPCPYDG